MELEPKTTVADLLNIAAENPAVLNLTLDGISVLVKTVKNARTDGLTNTMTLSQFYKNWYLPKIAVRNRQTAETQAERATAFKYWAQFTGDPCLSELNDDTIDAFVSGLFQVKKPNGKRLSDQTVKKHLAAVESVLMYAGPKSSKNKRAVGLIADVPEFPAIQKRADVNGRTPTFKEFGRILKACSVAKRPNLEGITAPEWWNCAYLFLYATGVRYSDFINARWENIKKVQDITALVIPSENEKTHRERIVPLNKQALAVLNLLPRLGREEKIFKFDTDSERAVYKAIVKERKRIARAAFVKPILATFHAIRRLTATMLEPSAAALVLGNNPLTCRQHYQTVAVAARAVEALPIPRELKNE